jgi:hypothetical protein
MRRDKAKDPTIDQHLPRVYAAYVHTGLLGAEWLLLGLVNVRRRLCVRQLAAVRDSFKLGDAAQLKLVDLATANEDEALARIATRDAALLAALETVQ